MLPSLSASILPSSCSNSSHLAYFILQSWLQPAISCPTCFSYSVMFIIFSSRIGRLCFLLLNILIGGLMTSATVMLSSEAVIKGNIDFIWFSWNLDLPQKLSLMLLCYEEDNLTHMEYSPGEDLRLQRYNVAAPDTLIPACWPQLFQL